MKLNDLFHAAIDAGIKADPRDNKQIQKDLKKVKDRQKGLKGDAKKFADAERTWNPYGDSRIIAGSGKEEVKAMMVGIDIETPEVLLADRLREKGMKIDALMIHHPEGRALMDLTQVMPLMIDLHHEWGVPVNITQGNLSPRIGQVNRSIHAGNLYRVERAAELMGFPAFTCHTPADNMAYRFIEKHICKKEFDTVGEIVTALNAIPEYEHFGKLGNEVILASGGKENRPGKVAAAGFTGGTNGPETMTEELAKQGIGTIISMHATEKEVEVAKKYNMSIVQCSHMASDSLGMNLIIDQLMKKEKKLSIIEVSGFIRVKR